MDNDTYDGIVERLREIDPTNPYFTELDMGAPLVAPDRPVTRLICISGRRDKALEERILEKGYSCTTILSAASTVLVLSDVSQKEIGKVQSARELGIPVLTRAEFIQQYLS
jgi:precorrin-6x reductase